MGNVNAFRHPLFFVTTVVVVVTVLPALFFATSTDLVEFVLTNENTFFGARSSGFNVTFAPVILHSSTNTASSFPVPDRELSDDKL